MRLPGGLVEDGVRRRDWVFRPLSGALELALAEVAQDSASTPQAVTRALCLALDQLAGAPPSASRVADLCVADRQFLMCQLDGHLGNAGGWFDADCARCGERFDYYLDCAALPVREAGDGYPHAQVDLDGRRLRFRLPTGADQEMIAALSEGQARDCLLRQLASEPDAANVADAATIAAIDAALEAVAPAIVLGLAAACPECGAANVVELDPYRALARRSDDLLHEVHDIALCYHWREADILDLPRARRLRYLQMIADQRGLAQ